MDEALGFCAVDVSGRPYLAFDAAFPQERVGDFDTCMTEEFFRALCDNAGFTLHLRCPYGKNAHHMIEALFKAAAHALCDATAENSTGAVLSTKGRSANKAGRRKNRTGGRAPHHNSMGEQDDYFTGN